MMIVSAKRSRPRHRCEHVLEATLAVGLTRADAVGEAQAAAPCGQAQLVGQIASPAVPQLLDRGSGFLRPSSRRPVR
jgi:hypothetical protein